MAYLAGYYDGGFSLLNSGYEGEMIAYEYPEVIPNTTFVLAVMSGYVPDTDDDFGGNDGFVPEEPGYEEPDDEEPGYEEPGTEDDEETSKPKRRRKVTVTYNWTNIILVIVGCVLGLAAVVVLLIIIIHKKKNKKNSN